MKKWLVPQKLVVFAWNIMENPIFKWMMTGGTPFVWKPPHCGFPDKKSPHHLHPIRGTIVLVLLLHVVIGAFVVSIIVTFP